MIELDDIRRAADTIEGVAVRTPVMRSRTLDRLSGVEVFLKCENFQRTGSFKFRGAYNAVSLLGESQKSAGVITHSSGNHGQALALAAALVSARARIVMPSGSVALKQEAVRGYGAEVILCDNTLVSREETCAALIESQGLSLVHPYDNELVMAGAGTAVLELIQEAGPLDYLLAPVGGGGLLSGTATAARGLCQETIVWGVEPAGADDALRSFRGGRLVQQTDPHTIADGLRTSLSARTFEVIRTRVNDIVTVEEDDIVEAMRFLWQRMKLVVEPSGAVPLAPVLKGMIPATGKSVRVGVIISGGNVDPAGFLNSYLSPHYS
ncbi:MAG: pyridoxal-phosphate dependent enzyme [Gemmatimonadota bacterium]|nr:pyridoxal-phosphate dependent enzyme [Gemmatimonadota bacterium]